MLTNRHPIDVALDALPHWYADVRPGIRARAVLADARIADLSALRKPSEQARQAIHAAAVAVEDVVTTMRGLTGAIAPVLAWARTQLGIVRSHGARLFPGEHLACFDGVRPMAGRM